MARARALLAATIVSLGCNAPSSAPPPAPAPSSVPAAARTPKPRAAKPAPINAPTTSGGVPQGIMRVLAFLRDREHLLALSWDGALAGGNPEDRKLNLLQIWDWRTRRVSATASGMGTVRAVALAADVDLIAAVSLDGELSLRSVPSFDAKWTAAIGDATHVSITQDGKRVLTGDGSGHVRLYDGATGKRQWSKKVVAEYVMDAELSRTGRYFAVGGNEKHVTVFDGRTRSVVVRLATAAPTEDRYGGVYEVAFSPDEKWLATGGSDDVMRVFALPSGKLMYSHKAGQPVALAWSPDSAALAWGGNYDGPDIKIVTIKDRSLVTFPSKHTLMINTLVWSPDGTQLLSGSRDKTIRVHQNLRPSSGP
jgi:WD40 repeat protein